jgi:hypothetical protein
MPLNAYEQQQRPNEPLPRSVIRAIGKVQKFRFSLRTS